jgi:hypothetical protein
MIQLAHQWSARCVCYCRRIKEYSAMVSNTVGITTVTNPDSTGAEPCLKTVAPVEYSWKAGSGGVPGAIFSLPVRNSCDPDRQRVWPISGVSVVTADSKVKLLVLAQVLCLAAGVTAESLQFRQYETVLLVVHNPTDAPQTWKYDAEYFPPAREGTVHWYVRICVRARTLSSSFHIHFRLPCSQDRVG